MLKIKHESKKTFEHLLFICRGTVCHREENANPGAAGKQKVQPRDSTVGCERKQQCSDRSRHEVLLCNFWPHTERGCPGIYWTERLCGESRHKEADLQSQRGAVIARRAPVFGKTLKYKARACVILECGASGLAAGGLSSHRKKTVCEEGWQSGTEY